MTVLGKGTHMVQWELFDFLDISSIRGKRLWLSGPGDYDVFARWLWTGCIDVSKVIVTATGYLINKKDMRVFTIHHKKTDKINGVVGKMDTHEDTLTDTLVKEIQEEIRIDVSGWDFSEPILIKQSLSESPTYGWLIQDNVFVILAERDHSWVIPSSEANKIEALGWLSVQKVRQLFPDTFHTNAYRLDTAMKVIQDGKNTHELRNRCQPKEGVYDIEDASLRGENWHHTPKSVDLGLQFSS